MSIPRVRRSVLLIHLFGERALAKWPLSLPLPELDVRFTPVSRYPIGGSSLALFNYFLLFPSKILISTFLYKKITQLDLVSPLLTRSLEPKQRLTVNTEVLYRNTKNRSTSSEGEGILCRVTSVIGEGKQRRYEIIDSDPDPPTPSHPYRASVNHLVPIPPPAANPALPDLPARRNVLALYPGTTTFYKAEVVSGWTGARPGTGGVKREEGTGGGTGMEGMDNLVRLRFEGEDEVDREMSVERRYVLPDKQ